MDDDPSAEIVPLSTKEHQSNGTNHREPMDFPGKKRKFLAGCNVQSVLVAAGFISVFVAILVSALVWTNIRSSTSASASPAPYVVRTSGGLIKGSAVSTEGNAFVAYKAIPFAKPPIGDLRFKRPEAPDNPVKNVPINSEDYKKSCWSATKTSSSKYYGEDCLYLNVYAPEGNNGPFPVIVWLHGGGFVAGSTFPEPDKMVHQGQVIVVTVNYRLGVFGFMTTQDEAFPSNNGLWDQYMAIKWVHENIQHFQGDPNSITLFGESAGAISAALHVLSPVSSKHFHKVILQSGAMTSTVSRNPQRAVNKFAELVGCTESTGSPNNTCLHNVDIDDVLKYSKPEWYASNRAQQQVDFVWVPVIDGEFIADDPLSLLSNTTFLEQQNVFEKDYMIGVLNDEGALLTTNFFYPISTYIISNSTFFADLQTFLLENRFGTEEVIKPALTEAVNTFYTGAAKLSPHLNSKSVLDLCGDLLFVLPALETALTVSNNQVSGAAAKTFLFHFDYCPATAETQAPCSGHGDILAYVFPRKNITDPVEARLSDLAISILARFATSSDPGAAVSCGWPEFEPGRRQYLRVSPSPDIRSYLYLYRMQFWLRTVPCLMYGNQHCE